MMQSSSYKNYRFICKQELLDARDYVTLRDNGAVTINITSKKRNDDINVSSGDKVHVTGIYKISMCGKRDKCETTT